MWLAPEKNGEKDLQLSFSEFKQIGRAWGKLREITFVFLWLIFFLKILYIFVFGRLAELVNATD